MQSLTRKFTGRLPRLHAYVIAVLLFLVALQLGFRIIFWLQFSDPADPVPGGDLLKSFYIGSRFDMQLAIVILIPVLLLGWIKFLHPLYSSFGKNFWRLYLILVVTALFLVYITDAGHYAYLQQRLNATALRFMENPLISAQMVWETYPVITGALITAVLVSMTVFALFRLTASIDTSDEVRAYWRNKRWYSKALLVFVTFIAVLLTVAAKPPDSTTSWYPLRWSDAFFSTHAFSQQLTSNPVIYFGNTMKNVAESYDIDATRAAYPRMVDYLGLDKARLDAAKLDAGKLDYTRHYQFADNEKQFSNVVVIILESFASYKSSLSGNPLDTTPNIKYLADNGYFFKNFYTPSTGTARSVWTFVTGIPDVEKNKTSSRNPLIVDQHTIIADYKQHEKLYFLGGSASWANIRGMLSSNIPGLKIYEDGSYVSEKVDVWGISDLSLFREAHGILEQQQQPFFAIIQTSGNHRPYTIPDDNAGFEMWSQDDLPGKVTDYGFQSVEELNSFRFMDHALGEYIRLVKSSNYADNTLFVLFGDHGIHAPTGNHVPAYEAMLNLQGLRVPLVFYGKNIIEDPAVFDTIASETDVLPTIASLTQTSHSNTTLGRDLTDTSLDNERSIFTIEHGSDRTIGLLSKDHYLLMQSDGSNLRLHDLASDKPRRNVAKQQPGTADDMRETLTALWNTIRYIRENNQPRPGNPDQPAPAGTAD